MEPNILHSLKERGFEDGGSDSSSNSYILELNA